MVKSRNQPLPNIAEPLEAVTVPTVWRGCPLVRLGWLPVKSRAVATLIGVTIYGNSGKHISVLCVLEWFFDVNSMVMSVL